MTPGMQPNRRSILAFAATLSIAILTAGLPTSGFAGDVAIDDIFAKWRAQEARVQSVKVEWKREEVIGQTVLDQECSLRIQGDWMDFRYEIVRGEVENVPVKYRSSFDGKLSKRLSILRPNLNASGTMTAEPHVFERKDIDLLSLLVAFRPLHATMSPLSELKLTVKEQPGVIGDRKCIVLAGTSSSTSPNEEYWVDPARDFVVVRYASSIRGNPSITLDIEYDEQIEQSWLPARWEMTFMKGSRLARSARSKITSRSLNEPIPQDEFQIVYPQGTRVVDKTGPNSQIIIVGETPMGH